MKRILAPLLVAGVGLALLPGISQAGANANAKIQLHLATTTTKNACAAGRIPPCFSMVTNGSLYPTIYFAYLLVADGNATAGVGGLQCGITYPGGTGGGSNSPINVYSWSLCATLEFPSTSWPAPGGGNLITWDTASKCQRLEPGGAGTGVVAAAGYFYLAAYGEGTLAVIPRPVDGKAKVADCASNEDLIAGVGFPGSVASHLGSAKFSAGGNIHGANPCAGLPGDLCHVRGPATVAPGQTGIVYTVDPDEVSSTGSWVIFGNGVIESSNNTSATVRATGVGAFHLVYQLYSGCVEGCGCDLNVTVEAPTAVEASSWSRIKAMYPGLK